MDTCWRVSPTRYEMKAPGMLGFRAVLVGADEPLRAAGRVDRNSQEADAMTVDCVLETFNTPI